MASRTYQNFDLLVEDEGMGTYRARVTTSPVGESPSVRFRLPFDETQLELLLLRLDPGRSGTRRTAGSASAQACLDLGSALFDAVFVDDLRLAWTRSQDLARQQNDGLRLRLRLSEAPAIAGLPWELLHDRRSNTYLAQSERTPVVRYLEVSHPPRPLAVDGPLRVLVVISSPTDLPELDVEQEWRRVQDTLAVRVAAGRIHLDRLEVPSKQALRDWLRVNDVHILHFIGHGDFDEHLHDGVIYFTDRFGRSAKVSPSTLGPDLRDHDSLRLVVLNACHSARADTTDPYSGMAQGLVQQDCAAVVAMQFPVSDGAAVSFTGEFYRSLAEGFPVDQAVTSARKAMLDDYATEWATPVVFLRSPDGQVFTDIVAEIPGAEDDVIASVDEPLPELVEPDPEPGEGVVDSVAPQVDPPTSTRGAVSGSPDHASEEPVTTFDAPGRPYATPPTTTRVRHFPSVARRRVVVVAIVVLLVALAVWGAYVWLNRSKSSSSSGGTRALGVVHTVGQLPPYLSSAR